MAGDQERTVSVPVDFTFVLMMRLKGSVYSDSGTLSLCPNVGQFSLLTEVGGLFSSAKLLLRFLSLPLFGLFLGLFLGLFGLFPSLTAQAQLESIREDAMVSAIEVWKRIGLDPWILPRMVT